MPPEKSFMRKYRKEWENEPAFKGWLTPNNLVNSDKCPFGDEFKEARCSVCGVNLRAHRGDLEKRSKTTSHQRAMMRLKPRENKQRTLEDKGVTIVSKDAKAADLCLAVHVAVHSSIRSIDHLSDLLTKLGKGSVLQNLRIHRTKCSMLILNAIAPAMLTALVDDIKLCPSGFSLILDESTDISLNKLLGIVIRYYSVAQKKVLTEFLGLLEVPDGTAIGLCGSLTEYLDKLSIDLHQMKGIGTDGANAMCGVNHSLFTLLRAKIPNLQLVKCVCHSLHLCASHATDELPGSLEFLVRETRNWFFSSPLRQDLYQALFKAINDGKVNRKLVALSKTRWLAFHAAIVQILNQWLELKTHFKAMSLNPKQKCHMASVLSAMFEDPANFLYLKFLEPVLEEVNRVNLLFQSESPEVTELFGELRVLLLFVARKIIKPAYLRLPNAPVLRSEDLTAIQNALKDPTALLPLHLVDFGEFFEKEVTAIGNKISADALTVVRQRCLRYLVVLCRELVTRLPTNMGLVESVKQFVPSLATNILCQPTFNSLPLVLAGKGANLVHMETQWKKMPLIPWNTVFNGCVPNDSCVFWSAVYEYTDAGGRRVFKDIAVLALAALPLPFSNAVVERVFSIMNSVRTKARNSLTVKMLEAIMRIRIHFQGRKTCCVNFYPTPEMFQNFTSHIYLSGQEASVPVEDEAIDEALDVLASEDDPADQHNCLNPNDS